MLEVILLDHLAGSELRPVFLIAGGVVRWLSRVKLSWRVDLIQLLLTSISFVIADYAADAVMLMLMVVFRGLLIHDSNITIIVILSCSNYLIKATIRILFKKLRCWTPVNDAILLN